MKSYCASVAAAILLATTVAAQPMPEESEPNDSFDTATPIGSLGPGDISPLYVSGCIDPEFDVDWFHVFLEYDLRLDVAGDVGYLALYSGAGELLAEDFSQLELTFLPLGVYYLRVTGEIPDCYELSLFAYPIPTDPYEPNNTPQSAAPIEVPSSGIFGCIHPEGDFDFFRFTLDSESELVIRADTVENLALYDAAGDLVAEGPYTLAGNLEAGEYFLGLTPSWRICYWLWIDLLSQPCPDADADGICNGLDNCPSTANSSQSDFDQDGVGDACDACPLDVNNDSDGDGSCDSDDLCTGNDSTGDFDTDGLCDDSDPCIGFSNTDLDNDGFCDDGDLCYGDDASGNSDGDGVCDDLDQCEGDDAAGDTDGDLFCDDIDVCLLDVENDGDGDGICEIDDNCELVFNPDQADTDHDGIGDACDTDSDNDGFANDVDNCPLHPNPEQADFDGDGEGDACDQDNDADGVLDSLDACLATPLGSVVNADGCSIDDLCPCENNWKNHGAYVKCVSHTANYFVDLQLIGITEHGDIVAQAAESTCGKKK
jgi:hypothetical protein